MFNRVKQLIRYVFPNYTGKDENMARKYLDKYEFELFDNMSNYDKKHSINILKDILKDIELKDNKKIIKLALLHDIGKEKDINIVDRILHVILKNNSKLSNHTIKGYEKLKKYNIEMAKLILEHHNKNIKNEELKKFQKLDDNN
ncbi:HD domain-containing protein [Haliovirga abyssi]|uniref:Phosphohydrolase n=1 Tax=Haliovirga abyssi TaxID=2996794 RepID=A0AAU9DCL0_9FUSO|nr:HD domain-containing protein [Haliovirga abyssi]BDU51231.1 phosphohydrolase [Haliovirga abyssi]